MTDNNRSIHKTSTGKIFRLTDFNDNPLDYNEYKNIFTRHTLAILEVGQILKSNNHGVMLKRIK